MLHRLGRNQRGFTVIEIVLVVVALSVVLVIAVPPSCEPRAVSGEGVLRNNLAAMRERLDLFKADRNKYPNSLQELVDESADGTPYSEW